MHFLARLTNLRMKKRISDETDIVTFALCVLEGTNKSPSFV